MGRLYIEGAGFSMESGTDRTPEPAKHYIFAKDQIVGSFESRDDALAEYRRMCRLFWNAKMSSTRDQERLLGARGLLSLDKSDLGAWEELARHGNPNERTKAAFWIRKLGGAPDAALDAALEA
ncbi:MAG: hypothetical protein LC772_05720 [Chloroflexi bacterium]|nr:hypothetical protein [Chloroflexota bacterium]